MTSVPQYNRVLLMQAGFMRPVKFEDHEGMIRDGSSLAYQIEELIALGAMEIAMEGGPMIEAFRERLSPSLRRRVRLIDDGLNCVQRAIAVMSPIAEELSLEFGHGIIRYKKSLKREIQDAAGTLFVNLHPFLLGVEYELQVDIDLQAMQSSVHLLRQELRNPRGRAFVSVLEGILATYKPISVTATAVRSMASDELISLFEEFVQDESYQQLSEQAHKLGYPQRAKRAVTLIGRYAKRLVAKPAFQQVANLSSRGISMATQVPLPNSEMCEALITSGFLPPIVSLRKAMDSAKQLWLTQKPDMILPPMVSGYWAAVGKITDCLDNDDIGENHQQNSPDEGEARD